MYQYPATGLDTDTLRPVAGNTDPRYSSQSVPSAERGSSASGWLVGLGGVAVVLLVGIGAMANTNRAVATSAAAANALPAAMMMTPVPVAPVAPVVANEPAPVAMVAPVAPAVVAPVAPAAEEAPAA
ncbi:MAG TPA: hypothetical protein VLT33_25735, partial [Labilithrix sp.]|nr:hypothetical protein [Labilithrix sp.]